MSDIRGGYAISIPNYGKLFYTENPKYNRISDVPVIKKVIKLLEKYNVGYTPFVDTVSGTFDLNQEWVETKPLMLDVQYDGALPIGWSDEDREFLRDLNYDGKIVMVVHWIVEKENGEHEWIPNH